MTSPNKRMHWGSVILVSICTGISRVLGFVRDLLFVRCLGARMISDAFLTALRIPNTFYEICAGGACGPAILPVLIHSKRAHGMRGANQLITALLAAMFIVISVICYIIGSFPYYVLAFVVPGFSFEQIAVTISLLRIFLVFMWVNTGTAILAEALRAERYFFVPAMGQVLVNISFITGLIVYYWWNITITTLAYYVVAGGILQCIMHACACWYVGYRPQKPTHETWRQTWIVLKRFLPCMVTSGINEIALFIELQFSSYLPVGSISLMTYASSIMRLPFGVLVHPLITVLLPELTKLQLYASRRVAFIMFEMLKLMLWILGPLAILMGWFTRDIFATLYGFSPLSAAAITTLQNLLLIKLCGLIFLSINHLCLQIFYVRHETHVPTMVSLATSAWSIVITYILYPLYGIYGIAGAGVATTAVRTLLFMRLIHVRIKIADYGYRLLIFLGKMTFQWTCCLAPWLYGIGAIRNMLRVSNGSALWYAQGVGLWLWVFPCMLLLAAILWFTRRRFGLAFYFLD